MNMIEPEVSQWYRVQDTPLRFEVLAIRDDFLIVQLENGAIEEYSFEQWEEMVVVPIDESGPWAISWSHDDESEFHREEDVEEISEGGAYYADESEVAQDLLLDDDLNELHDY